MSRFSKLHPIVMLTFFIGIIIIICTAENPIFTSVSLFGAGAYLIYLSGKKELKTVFFLIIPIVFVVGLFNFLFAHWGETVLFTFKETDFTLEALSFGLYQGTIFAGVTLWLICYSKVVSSEKFLSVFGKIFPNISLLISMSLGNFFRFSYDAKQIKEARKALGINEDKPFNESICRFSSLVTNSLEGSITKANSMKAKGYGKQKMKSFSRYAFCFLDGTMLFLVLILFSFFVYFKVSGNFSFVFDPYIQVPKINIFSVVITVLISFFPFFSEIQEDIRWHLLKQEI